MRALSALLLLFAVTVAAENPTFESLFDAATNAYRVAIREDLSAAKRLQAIEEGLRASDAALKLRPDDFGALAYKGLLLRNKAALVQDEALQQKLLAEADAIREKAHAKVKESTWTQWDVWLVQDRKMVFPENGVITLDRRPFSIHIMQPDDLRPVMLNASSDDRVFRRIVEGFDLVDDCTKAIVALCGGTGMAEEEFNARKNLTLGYDRMHYVYYEGPGDHRVSRYSKRAYVHTLERDVENLDDQPIEQSKIETLYLLFGIRTHPDGKLHEDELRRVTVRFSTRAAAGAS